MKTLIERLLAHVPEELQDWADAGSDLGHGLRVATLGGMQLAGELARTAGALLVAATDELQGWRRSQSYPDLRVDGDPRPTSNASTEHPTQPIVFDSAGVERFKQNAIVRYMLDCGNIDMNQLARCAFSNADWRQFAQLIGYSVDGYHGLSYVQEDEET